MRPNLLKPNIVLLLLLISRLLPAQENLSLVGHSMRYLIPESGQWSEWSKCTFPIFLEKNKIIIGSVPLGELYISGRTEKQNGDKRNTVYRCKSSSGTEFTINMAVSASDVMLTIEKKNAKMSYKCTVLNEKPYMNMVDLGLSCKWGMANYNNYETDIVSAVFGGGKRLACDEALKKFRYGKLHLPSTEQIKELLTKCIWEFIDNPYDSYHKCYLVTGPNGNIIFLPCNDGGDGNFSSAWYLGTDVVDAYLVNALQLNVNNKVIHPFQRNYYACVRLVEDN